MQFKNAPKILTLLLFISLFFGVKEAKAFTLDSVGAGNVANAKISTWSSGSSKPVFRGTTTPSGDVVITIDGSPVQVSADSAGAWVYTPISALTEGTHSVTISVGGVEQQNFELTITPGAMPNTGGATQTLMLLGLGTTSIILGKKFLKA